MIQWYHWPSATDAYAGVREFLEFIPHTVFVACLVSPLLIFCPDDPMPLPSLSFPEKSKPYGILRIRSALSHRPPQWLVIDKPLLSLAIPLWSIHPTESLATVKLGLNSLSLSSMEKKIRNGFDVATVI